jgi:hypothetical protein
MRGRRSFGIRKTEGNSLDGWTGLLIFLKFYLLAYALTPNHFDLLVCTPKGNLTEVMGHFNIIGMN